MSHVASVPLFWRLFVPNATVLAVASVVLMVQPANGRVPVLVGGLLVMLGVNLALMRRAFAPLGRLTSLMRRIDPLRPGERLPVLGGSSEVTLLSQAFNDMLDRLESERRDSARRSLSEREAERREIAAELHDELGQTLTAIALQVDRLGDQVPDARRAELREVRDAVLGTVEETRRLARKLRPEALDALGLVPALTNLSHRLTHQTGIQIIRRIDRDLPPLDPEAALVLYRVAQESLTNAIRHARADCVEIDLHARDGAVVLSIGDNGVGIDSANGAGTGIRAMRERALLVAGHLRIAPRANGRGTEVRLELEGPPE